MSLLKRDKQSIWHPYTQMKNALPIIPIVKGKGAYLFDEDGNKYIDAVSSWWTNIHGHSHPFILKAITKQIKQLDHVIFAGFTHEPAIELAEKLIKVLPSNQSKVFYSDNGSTAVEVAIKMAFQYWSNLKQNKTKIIAFKNAYHGDTFGAMSVSGRSAFNKVFSPFLFEVKFIDAPINGQEKKSIQQLKKLLKSAKNSIAAFIYEPLIQGSGGMLMHDAQPLSELIKLCKLNGVLTIADEVMTGFGRTGKMFASDFLSVKPDLICLSKGITGGTLAFGVTTCTKDIYENFLSDDSIKTFFHGHSYTANPIACASSIANLELFQKKETWINIERICKQHALFAKQITNHKNAKNVRQQGTIIALEVYTNASTSYFNSIRNKAYNFFLKRGIILRPLGNILYILPPYCITNKELAYIYLSINDFLNSISKN